MFLLYSRNYLERTHCKCEVFLPKWDNKEKILQDSFKDIRIDSLGGWRAILGLQFENLVLKNKRVIWQKLGVKPEDIMVSNPFFQRKTVPTPGSQIDYLIQICFNTLFVCEVKFTQTEIKTDVVQEMRDKLSRFILPRRFSCWPILIHVNGVSENVVDQGYFTKIIDFSELLEEDH